MNENQVKQLIQSELKSGLFTARKISDNPTENLSVVNRKYVNLNGVTGSRPSSSVASLGQQYFDTSLGYPVYWNGSGWVKYDGTSA